MQSSSTPCQRESLPLSRAGTVRRSMTANITGRSMTREELMPMMVEFCGMLKGDTVKMVTVGGVECSEETVKDGSYEVQRPFVFVTNKSVTLSEQAQAFFDFATSADAADLIRTAGAVPVNE